MSTYRFTATVAGINFDESFTSFPATFTDTVTDSGIETTVSITATAINNVVYKAYIKQNPTVMDFSTNTRAAYKYATKYETLTNCNNVSRVHYADGNVLYLVNTLDEGLWAEIPSSLSQVTNNWYALEKSQGVYQAITATNHDILTDYSIVETLDNNEEFVTLNGLKKYDHKKGTAEVDVSSLPLTPEHRVYVKHDNDKTVETVWAKDVEVATEYDVQNNIEYVSTVPTTDITSKIYGKVGTEGSFSCTEASMEAETDAMKVFFDFSSGTTKVPLYYNNKQIQTFAKPDTVYEFYDDLGNVLVDLTTAVTINYVEPNKYYAGDLTNQTTTELATADEVKSTYIPLSQKAKPKGVATLDANGRIPEEQMPLAALVYKGQWDASTGVFPVGTFVSGDFFVVSVAGTISGIDYAVGDWIIYNGSSWDLSENQNDVHSVNSKVGVVVLKDEDVDTAAIPTGSTVDYYIPETDTIQDALIKHDNELTSQDTRLDRIEAETNAEHTKQVTFFTNEAAIPTTTTDTFLFGVGEYAYAIAEQTWYKLTAIDTTTKALTWTEVNVGLATPYTAGEGIDITNNEITNTSRVWEGTQAEYNLLTPEEKVGIALFLITDSIGTGVVVDDVVEDGNLNAVTSNAVYDAIQTLGGKAIEYVSSLPVINIKDKIYGLEEQGSNPKFYAGNEDDQTTYKLGGSDIFTGTQAEWDALTTAEKNEYSQANITDSSSTVFVPVDTVADGNMNPVTSNAVYNNLCPRSTGRIIVVNDAGNLANSAASATEYTASDSGMCVAHVVKSYSGNTCIISVNDVIIDSFPYYSPTTIGSDNCVSEITLTAFVRKGDKIKVYCDGNGDKYALANILIQTISWFIEE